MLQIKAVKMAWCFRGKLILLRDQFLLAAIMLQSTKSFTKQPQTQTMLLQEGDQLLLDGRGQTRCGRYQKQGTWHSVDLGVNEH